MVFRYSPAFTPSFTSNGAPYQPKFASVEFRWYPNMGKSISGSMYAASTLNIPINLDTNKAI